MKNQIDQISYRNLIKNVARLGVGSALVFVHIAVIGSCVLLTKQLEKKKNLKNVQKALTYEK
jgi:hypothetical protein